MANRALFREFRKDGWPLCPRCEEDELWSSVAIAANRAVTLEECWEGEFACYYCNWHTTPADPQQPARDTEERR